ncbi:MAG: hypothetical protein ACUVSX_08750, partial [Aggregatilineales bacterium]
APPRPRRPPPTPVPPVARPKGRRAGAHDAGRGAPRAAQIPEAGVAPGPAGEADAVYGAPPLADAPAEEVVEAVATQPMLAAAPAPPLDVELFETALPLTAAALVTGGLALLLLAAVTTLARRHRLTRL